MKNSIIIAAIAICAIFSSNTASANTYLPTTTSISSTPFRFSCTINFGRRSKDCTGFGICSIVISTEMAPPDRASGNCATGTADLVNGQLSIAFKKSSMSRETIAKFFPNGKFVVEEDYQVAQEIISPRDPASGQATGRRQYQPLIIRKGVYNVQDSGDLLTVKF
jgi:hypothetical protein